MQKSPSTRSTYEAARTVVSRMVGDEMVLVDLETETYFGLNRVGSVIWTQLEDSAPVPDIVATIVDRFDVSPETAVQDVHALLDELERAGLARPAE